LTKRNASEKLFSSVENFVIGMYLSSTNKKKRNVLLLGVFVRAHGR